MRLLRQIKHAKVSNPRVLVKGPSSLGFVDRLARGLGWFSLLMGGAALLAPRRVAGAIGLPAQTAPMMAACGAREIATGVGAMSVNPRPAIWSRVAGDAMDLAGLYLLASPRVRRSRPFMIAVATVATVAVVDLACAIGLSRRHGRRGRAVDYSDRSGFPRPPEQMRGIARPDPARLRPGEPVIGATAPLHMPAAGRPPSGGGARDQAG